MEAEAEFGVNRSRREDLGSVLLQIEDSRRRRPFNWGDFFLLYDPNEAQHLYSAFVQWLFEADPNMD